MSNQLATITPGLEYDDAAHEYRLNGVRIPSVTQILDASGLIEGTEFFTEESRQRGTAVHDAIHFLNEDDLDWETLDPAISGYVLAVQRFWSETRLERLWSETPLAHPEYNYGMRPDVPVAILNGEPVVIDYKTGAYQVAQAVQIAAYVAGVQRNAENLGLRPSETPKRGIVVQLKSDGGYQIHDPRTEKKPINQSYAWATFHAALHLHRFKERFLNGNCKSNN